MMLGNLTVEELENRLELKFDEDFKKFLESTHQRVAENIKAGKWHCFDIPFTIVCGDRNIAQNIYDYLKNFEIKEKLEIAINTGSQNENPR